MAPSGTITRRETDTFGQPIGTIVEMNDLPCRNSKEVAQEEKMEQDAAYQRKLEKARQRGKPLKF